MTKEFKKALADYIEANSSYKVKEVLDLRQVDVDVPAPFCGEGTCWQSEIHVRIYYIRGGYTSWQKDHAADFDYEGPYVDFVRDLTGTPDYMLD